MHPLLPWPPAKPPTWPRADLDWEVLGWWNKSSQGHVCLASLLKSRWASQFSVGKRRSPPSIKENALTQGTQKSLQRQPFILSLSLGTMWKEQRLEAEVTEALIYSFPALNNGSQGSFRILFQKMWHLKSHQLTMKAISHKNPLFQLFWKKMGTSDNTRKH